MWGVIRQHSNPDEDVISRKDSSARKDMREFALLGCGPGKGVCQGVVGNADGLREVGMFEPADSASYLD